MRQGKEQEMAQVKTLHAQTPKALPRSLLSLVMAPHFAQLMSKLSDLPWIGSCVSDYYHILFVAVIS